MACGVGPSVYLDPLAQAGASKNYVHLVEGSAKQSFSSFGAWRPSIFDQFPESNTRHEFLDGL